ncbi:MAG: hypothetical protein SH856_05375 [Flavobacteriales bacterium]|nr:hypothetical protein [Flavobacteriales bacterium]
MTKTKKLNWNFNEVLSHIETTDTKLSTLMHRIGPMNFNLQTAHFTALVESIISQQLSVKASDTIFKRLETWCNGNVEPKKIAPIDAAQLRVFGISNQKAGYLINLANHFVKDPQRFAHLATLSDDEVIEALVEIKGIGVWTAQMFLMFTLGRMDVFAPGDLGLRNAMMKLYGWKQKPDAKKLTRKSLAWKPYRTVACKYLWRSLSEK